MHNRRRPPFLLTLFLVSALAQPPVAEQAPPAWSDKPVDAAQRVIVQLAAPPVVAYRRTMFPDQPGREPRSLAAEEQQSLRQYARQLSAEQQRVIASLQAGGLVVRSIRRHTYLFNGFLALAPADRIKELAAVPGVRSVSLDRRVRATLADSVPLIGAPTLWAMTDPSGRPVRGAGIRVAIIDTGVDYTHPDLGGCFGSGCRVVAGYDFVNNDTDPRDDNGHGTHVAGIVAASGTVTGVAPEATLYALKVLDAEGSGWTSDVIAALEWAVDPDQDPATGDGAQVVNLSLGGPGNPDDPVSQAVDAAVDAGVVVAVAAGNTGDEGFFTVGSPGTARKAITVGASSKSDALASFSSKGPVAQGWLLKPDLLAPGVSINSTVLGSSYRHYSGTSMATPHIAGAAALLRQLHPDWSPLRVKAVLMNTALDLGLDVLEQGAGRVQLVPAASPWVLAEPGSLSLGVNSRGQPTWTAVATITLTNLGESSATCSLSVAPGLPAGVNATLSSGSVLLAPEGSIQVTLTVRVDNSLLTPPGAPTFTVSGEMLVQPEGSTLRVPFAFGVQQGADAYEPDNSADQASPIPTDGTAQTHNFHEAWDEDWTAFAATIGLTYVIETGNLGPESDTYLELIDTDGTTLLAEDDDGGLGSASLITWTAPADGVYFVRVYHFDGTRFGDNTRYDLQVSTSAAHPDLYEPDDTYDQAALIPTDGTAQTHNFHLAADEDWSAFAATGGVSYTIQTGNLGSNGDTVLHLYDTNGTSELAYDDDGADELFASRLKWVAPATGTYFVRVHHYNASTFGDNTRYDLWLTACSLPEDLNGDGVIDLTDLQAVIARWGQRDGDSGWDPRFDLDRDGDVDMIDVMRVAGAWERTCL